MRRTRSLSDKLVLGVIGLSVALLGVSLFLALKDDSASEPQTASGVYGRVMTTACHPVSQVGDPPCPPYYGEISVLRRDESLVMTVHTDRGGRYRVQLPPGRYIIDSNDGGKSVANREGYVTVREGAYARVDVSHWVGVICLFGQTWMHVAVDGARR